MDKIKELFIKYKSIISYGFFGGCATIINIASYALFYNLFKVSNIPSTILAWILAFIFAFVTNKLWVFESKSMQKSTLLREFFSFFLCRALTGVLDVLIMYIGVDVLHGNAIIYKVISNIIVIILNYVASKLWIFKKDNDKKQSE